jgi:hypothetical protein
MLLAIFMKIIIILNNNNNFSKNKKEPIHNKVLNNSKTKSDTLKPNLVAILAETGFMELLIILKIIPLKKTTLIPRTLELNKALKEIEKIKVLAEKLII